MWRSPRRRRISAAQESSSEHIREEGVKLFPDDRSCLPHLKVSAPRLAAFYPTGHSLRGFFDAFRTLCAKSVLALLRISKPKCLVFHRSDTCSSFKEELASTHDHDKHLQYGSQPARQSPTASLIDKDKRGSFSGEQNLSGSFSWNAELLPTTEPIRQGIRASLVDYRSFTLHELNMATLDFSEKNLLGKGSSGSVYRGKLGNGCMVAVKVLSFGVKDAEVDFLTELEIMRYIRHRHILPVLGYCMDDHCLYLVYNYVRRGSLEAWLHGDREPVLSWRARCKVAVGIAKALLFLHTGCIYPVIHRDVKPSNVLLSDDDTPKLSDFGLAIRVPGSSVLSKEIMGTFGYIAPEYFQRGKISTKIDVYSFGVMLLELMTGRRPIDGDATSGGENLVSIARHQMCSNSGCIEKLADPKLKGLYSTPLMRRMLCTAVLCVHPNDTKRPSSSQVLSLMQKEKATSMNRLLLEAYATFSCPSCDLSLSENAPRKVHMNREDERKRYMEVALTDAEEESDINEESALLNAYIS